MSLVMSQVAPSVSQHSYPHHIMVGGDTQQPADGSASRAHHERSNTAQSASTARSETSTPAQPPSPPLQPRDAQPPSNNPQQSQHAPSNRPPVPRASSSHPAHSVNIHSRGFDQSGFPLSSDPRGLQSSPSSPRLQPTYRSTRSLGGSEATSPSRLRVRDLAHIQSFASQEYLARPRLGPRHFAEPGRQYEISSMPVTDIIEMVAGLLTRITTTNDRQHEHIHKPMSSQQEQSAINPQSSCVLAFHGKNVPSITILSYLSRIHKYCPTTYEVFLSLLVYFDRMTDSFNRKFLQEAAGRTEGSEEVDSHASSDTLTEQSNKNTKQASSGDSASESEDQAQFFVVDSYNIHRLVIAGVTCASKFFSDVFYTNSRYAKVRRLICFESKTMLTY